MTPLTSLLFLKICPHTYIYILTNLCKRENVHNKECIVTLTIITILISENKSYPTVEDIDSINGAIN